MNFSRKTILVVGAALLAACGDKVTVQEYTPPATTAKVNSVEVTPAQATLNIGQTITMTAAVNADAGLATTVTWSSSDATKASVSTAGVVTAVAATPGVAICATSTVDTGKKGCATIVVSAATQVIPASVSIASITFGNLNTPVNPAAVAGQIDVRLNVNPGNQTISKIVLVIGGVRADSQTYTAAQAAALRFAAEEAVAAQTTFPQVLFSVATNKFNATTGVPTWLNVAQLVSAQLFTTAGGASSAASATAQTTLTFANADTYAATVTPTGTTANALDAAGFRYDRGGLSVSVLPVIYSGRTIASATVLFGNAACDASAIGQRNTALAAPASGSSAWTVTWANSTPTGGSNTNFLTSYEFTADAAGACALLNPIGETIAVTAVDGNGDAILAAAAPVNAGAANSFRLDNRAPAAGNVTLVANPNSRQNGWFNAAVAVLSTNTSATSNGLTALPATVGFGASALRRDMGQGGYTRYARVAANTGGLVNDARAATASSTFTLPAPSLQNNDYCLIITAQDGLGNETARPASGTACTTAPAASSTAMAQNYVAFGVDIAAPTIALVNSSDVAGSIDANERRNGATMTNTFRVQVSDTGTVGNSGMLSGSSVMGTVTVRNDAAAPAYTAAQKCVVGTVSVVDGVTCLSASVEAAPAFPYVVTGVAVTGSTRPGYFTYTAVSRDAAGNSSGSVTRVASFDLAANVPALTSALFNIPLNGGAVTFNANASDNFDLWKTNYTLTYAGGLAGPILYPPTVINSFNGTQMYSNVPAGFSITNFIRQIEDVTGNAPVTVSGAYKPNNLAGVVTDQANVPSAVANTPIAAASVTTGTSYLAAAAPQLIRSWAITNAATNISTGATSPAANPLSVTLTIDAFGPTATFNPPFARVDLYALIGGNLEQIGTTTSFATVDDGSAFGRRHRYSFTWTPGQNSPITSTPWVLGAQALYAIGVNAAGDALVTPVGGTITLTNP